METPAAAKKRRKLMAYMDDKRDQLPRIDLTPPCPLRRCEYPSCNCEAPHRSDNEPHPWDECPQNPEAFHDGDEDNGLPVVAALVVCAAALVAMAALIWGVV